MSHGSGEDILFVFELQSLPEVGLVFEFSKIALYGARNQVVARRLQCHVPLNPMEGVHQHALMFERIGGAQIFEFHAAGRCHAEHHEQ